MFVSPQIFRHIEVLYDQSLHLRAYHAAQAIAPLEEWEGTAARILAGRLAATVGAPNLGRKHQLLAYRHDPKDWEARYYYARIILRYRGPIAAWQFLRQHDDDSTLATADPKIYSDWLAFHAFVLAQLRDFERTEHWLAQAEKVAPENVWVWVERAKVFELQGRYEDTLSVLRYALILQPWFRPTIQTSARALVQQGREEEALRLLAQASQHIECAWLVEQLAQLQIELGQFTEAQQSLERFIELSPCLEPELWEQLQAQRADVAYLKGDYSAAMGYANQCVTPVQRQFAARLEQGVSTGHRVILPIEAVRQPQLTGAPAILAAISQYYKIPAQPLSQLRQAGASAYQQRQWAQKSGFAVREFRVTWESAVELLKRKIAFTLELVEPGKSSLQAVIGYDSVRHTLLVRDAAARHYRELDARKLLDRYRGCGPRGMALLPAQHAKHLDSLSLTEAEHYDQLYALQDALAQQDRTRANEIYQTLQHRFGTHRLTWQAKLALASYDGDHKQKLACYEKLAELFPEDDYLKLEKVRGLGVLAHRNQRLEYLKKICTRKASPLLWLEYAKELSDDARQWPQAVRWMRKAWQRGVIEPRSVHLLATICWQQQQCEEALELYRFAACLDDSDESAAQSFFLAAHQLEQTETALAFLHDRLQPVPTAQRLQTLFQSMVQLGQKEDALAILEASLTKAPDDGSLKLLAAELYARHGDFSPATSLLQQAQTQVPNHEFLRMAASLATLRGHWKEALQQWLQVVAVTPLSLEANQQTARLLADLESPQAALNFLREVVRRHLSVPYLRVLLVEWSLADPALAETELRLLLKYDATNDWAQSMLARVLLELRRNEEALAVSETACRINAVSAENHCLRGQVLAQVGRSAQAQEAFRLALTFSADHTPAMENLVTATATLPQQRASLLFVQQELIRQVSKGEGWRAFRELAKGKLEAMELLQQLREMLRQRPELPFAWSAVITQLLEMQQPDEAYSVAHQATKRFPLMASSWFDLALTYEAKADFESQCNALQHALLLNPGWALATEKLVKTCERLDKLTLARTVLERALTDAPLDHTQHGLLADVLWKLGEQEAALTALQRALSLEPDYDWGWRLIQKWAEHSDQPELALQCARALVEHRPGAPRLWLILARTLQGKDALPEQLAALDRALTLAPRFIEAHHLRALLLAEAGRYDEALRACRPSVLAPLFPPALLSAEAYITAQCGDLQLALKKLRAVLIDEPHYAPGWEQIARWYRTLELEKSYLEAAQNLTRLRPQDAAAYGYLGEARLRNEDREGAKEAFHRALELTPDYEFAGFTLFDLHLEDGHLRDAGEVLQQLIPFLRGDAITLRALKLALKSNDYDQAQKHLIALCLSPTAPPDCLDSAVAVVTPTKLHKILDTVFEEVLAQSDVNPHVGKLWVQHCAAQNRPDHCLQRLEQMATERPSQFWYVAAATFLRICADNGAIEHVRKFVQKYEGVLRHETASWASVGLAFYYLGETQAMVEWMSDWQQRADIAPTMLWNLVLALRDLHRDEQAREVGLYAVSLPEDERTCSHLALLSLDEALAGRIRAADQHAARIAPQTLNEWDQVMMGLATGLREFHTARAEGRAIGQVVIDRLMQLAQQTPWLKQSHTLVTLFRRAIESVLTNENDSLLKVKTKLKLKWFEYRAS